MKQKLEEFDSEFKTRHYDLVDVVDAEEALQKEHDILDEHDNGLAILAAHVRQLITAYAYLSPSNLHMIASKRLLRLQRGLSSVNETIVSWQKDLIMFVAFISMRNSCLTLKGNLVKFVASCYPLILKKLMNFVLCKCW